MRNLVLEDDPILRKRCLPFDFDNPQEDPKKLAKELVEAMYKYEGLGLSACQIGVDLKVFSMISDDSPIICFNPRITEYSEETTYMREGCLTFPGLWFPIQRAHGVNVTFANEEGENMNGTFVQLTAKIFQHEYDHMLGKLYIEYASVYMMRNARKKQILWKRKRKNNGYGNF
jgi:peptide deformylase